MKKYERKYWANRGKINVMLMVVVHIFLILSGFILLYTSANISQTFIGGVLILFFSFNLFSITNKVMTALSEYESNYRS